MEIHTTHSPTHFGVLREVVAQPVERPQGPPRLLRAPHPPGGGEHPVALPQLSLDQGQGVPNEPTGRTGQAGGSAGGDGGRTKQDGFITRIVRRIRRGGDQRPSPAPSSDADFAAKIETAKRQLAYSQEVMRTAAERAENLRRINRTGNFVEGWLVPERRKEPNHERA